MSWVDPTLAADLRRLEPSPALVDRLVAALQAQRFYITDAVKCCDDGAKLPTARRLAAAWPQLADEIALTMRCGLVAFGLLPFGLLTGQSVRLADVLWDAQHGQLHWVNSRPIAGVQYPVLPCYFPTGRGNPVGATKLLRALRTSLESEQT